MRHDAQTGAIPQDAHPPAGDPASQRTRRLRVALYVGTAALGGLVVAAPVSSAVAEAIDPPSAVVVGTVFEDRNGNDTFDDKDVPLEGVSVSDGAGISVTDAEGRYTLETPTERRNTEIVFITQPAGYSVGTDEFMTPRFYRNLGALAAGDEKTIDFSLTKDTKSAGSNFTFGNIADPHVNAELPEQVQEINSTQQDLAFIQVSGDLTNGATQGEFDYYKAATALSNVPVWPAVGNHEYSSGSGYANRINNYRNNVGPEWYSFDYGDRHFLVLENNGSAPFEEQLEWAKQDLERNVGDKDLVVLTHQPMNVPFGSQNIYDQYGALLEQYGAELILVGHEHSNDVEPNSAFAGSAKHIQTASSSYTIDNSPRGFRYVSMTDEAFENPFRMYGAEKDLTITSPANGTSVPLDGFPGIQVNAYDTSDAPAKVQFRVDGGNWRPLKPTGEFTWHSELQGDLQKTGEHTVEVQATDDAGASWSAESTFTLTDEKAIAPVPGADWSQHHGNEGHTGVAADEIDAGQRLAWSYRTEGTFLTGSPAIVDGVVYAGTRDENGDGNSEVHAVDQITGKQLWSYDVPSSVHGSIAVSDGLVFVPTLRGTLFAVDAATGELKWQHDPEPAPEGFNQRTYGYYGVTVADGKVLYPYQTRHGEASRGLLIALDVTTGERIWASAMSGATMSDGTPAVSDGRVYVGNQTADRIMAYNLETGALEWTGNAQLGGWQDGIPAAADGKVFIGSNNGIIARDGATGKTLWTYRSSHPSLVNGGATPAAPTISGNVVYMGFPSGAVTALDATTGAVIWDRLLPGEKYRGGIHTSPALSGETLFVGSNNGNFYALDSSTGQPLWQQDIGTWVSAGPAVSGNTAVVGALDGNLYAFTPGGTAAEKWPLVSGTVTEEATGEPAAGVGVQVIRDGAVIGTTTTAPDGTYRLGLEKGAGTYTVQAAELGFSAVRKEVDVVAGEPSVVDLTLAPVNVDASTGKRLNGVLVEGGVQDIVIENRKLAIAISKVFNDPQLNNSTVGKPLDVAITGQDDQLDWINLPYVSTAEPVGGNAWQQLAVRTESVEIVENTGERAVVRATGTSADHPGLTVVTTYTANADDQWITADTEFRNTTGTALPVWVGDAMDYDGAGQRSGVAGHPVINTGSAASYEPSGTWIGQTGTGADQQTYGLIYTAESGKFTGYGFRNWVMSKFQVEIPAGGSHTLSRRVVVAPNGGAANPFAVLDELATQ
ncbi:outer membrane protein assembly factor BamB family protein [Arthrobacter subterraneus]|uniref:outer membrane protein assembly factor BamB family protein n=1 Tax=Arthrobacter subterraneus TaxID=335973 RepID=UPI0037F82373